MASDRFATKEDALLVLDELRESLGDEKDGFYYVKRLAKYYTRQSPGCKKALRMAYRESMLSDKGLGPSHVLAIIEDLKLREMEADVMEYRDIVMKEKALGHQYQLETIDRILDGLSSPK